MSGNNSEAGCKGIAKNLSALLPVKICFAIPAVLLVGAYLYMTFFYQKLWLFDTIVHENGKYTLLEVIFYFRHFSWEMPGKAVYSIFVVGIFYYYGNPVATGGIHNGGYVPKNNIYLTGVLAVGIIIITTLISVSNYGIAETMHGYFQFRTSEIKPLVFGSHWKNHFLSNIVLFCASAFLICLYRIVFCGGWMKRKYAILYFIAVGIFVLLSIIFGLTNDSFETPSYLGHQLREIFGSDLSVTMFLSVAVLIYFELRYDRKNNAPAAFRKLDRKNILYLFRWITPVVLITGYTVIKVLSIDISGEMSKLPGAKQWTVIDIFAWHFFEHVLDYFFVVFSVSFLYLLTLKMEFGKKAVNEK